MIFLNNLSDVHSVLSEFTNIIIYYKSYFRLVSFEYYDNDHPYNRGMTMKLCTRINTKLMRFALTGQEKEIHNQ